MDLHVACPLLTLCSLPRYFANLSSVASSVEDVPVPSRAQLKLVLQRADGAPGLPIQHIEALCTQASIAASVVARVIEAGRFRRDIPVDVDKFLFLLLAMTCDNFGSVIDGIFELFGAELPSNRFVDLVAHLAPDMDPEVTTQFLADLRTSLTDVESITLGAAVELDVLREKLEAS